MTTMKKSFWLPIALGLSAYLVLPLPGLSAPLSDRIDQKRHEVDEAKQEEGVLTTTIQRFSNRIDGLQGEIRPPSSASTGPSRASTARSRSCSRCATGSRSPATGWRGCAPSSPPPAACSRPGSSRSTSRTRPDALTVVLEADGFADLLERTEFLARISDQDREITDRVRGLRDQAEDQAIQLAKLEEREQLAAERILRERDQIASAQNQLVSSRDQLASARSDKRGALASVRARRTRRSRTSPRWRPSRPAWRRHSRARPHPARSSRARAS